MKILRVSRRSFTIFYRLCFISSILIYSNCVLTNQQALTVLARREICSFALEQSLLTKSVGFTEYTRCQAFCPVVGNGSPHPLTRKRVLRPPVGSKGGDTLACGGSGGGGRNQFRRRDRRSGTLSVVLQRWLLSPVYCNTDGEQI
jgi:hypothetical protein